MIRRVKQLIFGALAACLLASILDWTSMTALAADASISFSDPSASVGAEVSVTMKITSSSALGRADVMLSYDPTALEFISGAGAEGDAGAVRVSGVSDSSGTKEFSYVLKFRALKPGSTEITVSDQEIYDGDARLVSISKKGDSTVTVKSQSSASKDASLKSLKVFPGALNPEFSPEVYAYTVNVGGDTDRLAVDAECADPKATNTVTGNDGLKVGENDIVCKVTAEDGVASKSYLIKVIKAEGQAESVQNPVDAQFGDLTVILDNVQYKIALSFDETALPEGFEAAPFTYKDNEVMAGRGLVKELTLLYLRDASGAGGFYIYDENRDSWSPFTEIATTAKSIVLLPPDESVAVPEGYVPGTLEGAAGWVWSGDKDPQYWLFYGMNWKGEKALYRYDLVENTIQRYFEDPAAGGVTKQMYDEAVKARDDLQSGYNVRFYIIVGLIVLCLLLVAALAALIIRKPPHGPEDGGGSAGGDSEAHNSRRGNVRRDRYEAEEKPTEVKNSATGDHKSGAGAPGEAGDTSLLERKARAVIHNEERTLETELALEASKMWEQDDDELFETVELGTEEKRDEDDGDDFEFLDINL